MPKRVAYTRCMTKRNITLFQMLGIFAFLLPFLAVGLCAGYWLLMDLRDWYDARAYVPALAHIESLHLFGGESVKAEYRYAYDGRIYTSSRVGINDDSSLGHRDLFNTLWESWHREEPVTAWVNPQQPSHALLDRGMPWDRLAFKFIFFLMFAGFELLLLIAAFKGFFSAPQTISGITLPAEVRINDQQQILCNPAPLVFYWLFTLTWNLFSVSFCLFADRSQGWFAHILLGLFLLIGLLILFCTVFESLRRLRFGTPALTIDPLPARTGGVLHGSIRLKRRLADKVPYLVTLSCTRERTRDNYERTVWREDVYATCSAGPHGTQLDFRINVPPGLPASRGSHRWKLQIEGKVPNLLDISLHHNFTVPVIAGKPEEIPYDAITTAAPIKPTAPEIPPNIARIHQAEDVTVVYYPPSRNRYRGTLALVWGTAILVFMVSKYEEKMFANADPQAIMFVMFLLAFFTIPALLGLYLLLNSLQVEASTRELVSRRRILGIAVTRRVPTTEISRIEHRDRHRRLVACLRNGRAITVGDGIPRPVGEHLQGLLQQALQLKTVETPLQTEA